MLHSKSNNTGHFLPKIVLGVAAHADDLEFCIGGSVAQWVREGAQVYYLILTSGDKGTADRSLSPSRLRTIRRREQLQAAKALGVTGVFFTDYEDCSLRVCKNVQRDVVRAIRRIRPDTVITMDPTMVYCADLGIVNHPDHRAAGQATLDAVFPMARDYLSFPELKLEPHEVATLLLVNYNEANFHVDITKTLDAKIEALQAHSSQFPDMADTIRLVNILASRAGAQAGYAQAEAFMKIDVVAP